MNVLHLSGYGVKIKTEHLKMHSELSITDGKGDPTTERETYRFRPRRLPYDTILIDGHSGYISLQALHWLSHNSVPVYIMNFDGTIISSILPPTPVKADVKVAQIHAASDKAKRLTVARRFVEAKIKRTLDVLHWIGESYDIAKKDRQTEAEALKLTQAETVKELRIVEGRVAKRYWETIKQILPECFCFQTRKTKTHQNNATDPVNVALNYGYGVLEGYCRKAINTVGLEPSIGFLHEFTSTQTKQSLVYDLQEPFRWLADVTVLEAFESGVLDVKDFYFLGDDYRYRFDPEPKRRFLGLLKDRFNAGVTYRGQKCKWDTIILRKAQELARFLNGKSKDLCFSEPAPDLNRADNIAMRQRILQLTQSEARELGIGKSTLHYLRKHAQSDKSFRVYGKVAERLILKT